jgi:hypothetical protein
MHSPTALDGLYAAIVSGVFGVLLWWLTKWAEKPRRRTAWERQSEKLRDELRAANAARILFLEQQLKQKDLEIIRLNRLLNRERGRHDGA